MFILVVVAFSAVATAWESINRLFRPPGLHNGWFVVAGLVGYAGSEIVAI